MLGGEALDGEREDLLRILLSVAARLFLQIPHQRRRLAPRLVLEAPQQLLLRFHSGETRDLFQPGSRLMIPLGELALARPRRLMPPLELPLPVLQRARPMIERLLAALDAPAPLGYLLLPRFAGLQQLRLGGEHHALARFFKQPLALGRGGAGQRLRRPPPDVAPRHVEIRPGGDPTADDARDDCRQIRHMVNYLQHRSAHRSEAKGCSVTAATQVSTDGA